MVVKLSKRRVSVAPYRAVLWSVVAIVAFLALIQHRPITLEGDLDLADGTQLTHSTDADVVVVVDYEAIRQSGDTFDTRDFSAGWIDIFYREIGPTSVATPETLDESLIENSRVIVLTRSVSADLPDTILERIREEVLDGTTVVVERPEDRARELFSADGDAGERQGHEITHVEGLGEPFDEQLKQMPILADYVGSTSPRDDATTLLAIDGAPAVYAAEFGDGHAITVDFDLGRQTVAMQQGRPEDDFTVTADEARRPPTTRQLVADDDLLGAPVPYLDLLNRFLVHQVIAPRAGIPSIWPYPDGAAGAVIFAHEDWRLGDGGSWMMEQEQNRGGSSTLLTTADSGMTEEGAHTVADYGGQLGLAWRIPDPAIAHYEPLGFGSFQPFRRPIDLQAQRDQLVDAIPQGSIGTSRALGGVWDHHWSTPMAALAELGIRADVSYEAPPYRGFAFGSGKPYLPLNDEGLPLQIRQYPVVAPANADRGPEIAELLAASSKGHHQLLTIGSRPSWYADYPDVDRFEKWLALFDDIQQHNHDIVSVSDYASYQRTRRNISLRSRVDHSEALPDDLQTSDTGPDHRADLLRITADASRRGMELMVPTHLGDAEFFAAVEGTERVGDDLIVNELETETDAFSGIEFLRVELERGFNRMEFYYR